jgi:hypothetical protein
LSLGGRLLAPFGDLDWDPATTVGVGWEWYVRLGLERGSELEPGLHHETAFASEVEARGRPAPRAWAPALAAVS